MIVIGVADCVLPAGMVHPLDRSLVPLVSDYSAGKRESVVADEPCEAASGDVAVVKSASSVNQVLRVYRCQRIQAQNHSPWPFFHSSIRARPFGRCARD